MFNLLPTAEGGSKVIFRRLRRAWKWCLKHKICGKGIPSNCSCGFIQVFYIKKYEKCKKGIDYTNVEKRFHHEDLCGICLDRMDTTEPLYYCKYSCGKCVHKKCMDMMIKHYKYNNKTIKCVFCNKEWYKKKLPESKYINIS